MKLRELALNKHVPLIKSGLVLARKATDVQTEREKQYPLIIARTVNDDGKIVGNETFDSKELLEEDYLTQVGDVLVKIAAPNVAVYISEENTGKVISSYFCVIRNLNANVLPEYLAVYLNSLDAKMQFKKDFIGTTVQTLKMSALLEVEVPVPTLQEQRSIIELYYLKNKEIELLHNLARMKEDYFNAALSEKFRRIQHAKR